MIIVYTIIRILLLITIFVTKILQGVGYFKCCAARHVEGGRIYGIIPDCKMYRWQKRTWLNLAKISIKE